MQRSICQLKSQYNGSDQHDSQEFLSFLIDGIHEDLNRIIVKPLYSPTRQEEAELERLPTQIASDREWRNWRSRNDSLIVDFFQGQFRNRLECLTCHKVWSDFVPTFSPFLRNYWQTSTTYNVFSILQLPIPNARSGRIPIERCLDAFFNEEILEKDDAWYVCTSDGCARVKHSFLLGTAHNAKSSDEHQKNCRWLDCRLYSWYISRDSRQMGDFRIKSTPSLIFL